MFADPTKKFDSAFLSNYYNYTIKLVCLWNGRLNCWPLYIMTGFSWPLYIQTDFLRSLYIMTEMMAVLIYNDWFRIRTTTHTHWHVLIKISMENRDDKFLEWDYWSLHWWKKLTLQIHTRCMPKNYMLVLTDWKFQSLTKKSGDKKSKTMA